MIPIKKPLLFDITSPYSSFEAWFYDTFIAPALLEFKSALREELLHDLGEGSSLLDVGCGGGHALQFIGQERPDLELFGLDLSMGQVRRANKRTVKFGSRSHSIRGTALELPFEDERFDSLISIASVKHWPNPERGLQECLRVLESGKPFLIVEAARESTLEDVKQFVSEFRFPGFLTPIIARGFKRFVAGQALTNREARNLFSNINLDSFSVEKMEGLPGLKIRGIK